MRVCVNIIIHSIAVFPQKNRIKVLPPFNPEGVAIESGRLMLKRIDYLLEAGESFSIETTLATKSYINLVRRAHEKGYWVHLLFFWLDSIDLAKERVECAIMPGIPQYEAEISRNFKDWLAIAGDENTSNTSNFYADWNEQSTINIKKTNYFLFVFTKKSYLCKRRDRHATVYEIGVNLKLRIRQRKQFRAYNIAQTYFIIQH